jgi:hypothetical protein
MCGHIMSVKTKYIDQVEKELGRSDEVNFPRNGFFLGMKIPYEFEAKVYNCVIREQIPEQIAGTFYRVMPDALWALLYEDGVFVNSDSCMNALRLKYGYADFKSRFVCTEKVLY